MKYDFVTIGDAFEDVFVFPKGLHVKRDNSFACGFGVSFELGEKIPLSEVQYEVGGSACNASIGFKRLGMNSSLVTVCGQDTPAEKIKSRLDEENVNLSNIKVIKDMKTNFSTIFSLPEGRTIFVYHGLKDYGELRIKKTVKSKWFFLAPIGENTFNLENDLVAKVCEENSLLAWNPGAIQIAKGAGHFRNLLKNISALFLNREEALKFLNLPVRPNEDDVLRKLQMLGPKLVVVTNGAKGAKAYDGNTLYSINPRENIEVKDPTGAGDSFAVGVLSKLETCGWRGEGDQGCISEALKWGILNSSSVITHIGAQKGLLTTSEMVKELNGRNGYNIKAGTN